MKKTILFLALMVSFTAFSYAQSDKYMGAMQKNLSMMDTAFANPSSLLSVSNNFERIATAEKNQWLPYYYAALSQVNYGFRAGDMSGGDPIADKAESLLNKADSLSPNNSEISLIKAMIGSVRMLVNPQARYMQMAGAVEAALKTAEAQDPANPRPYYYKAQTLKKTPEQFGGGCDAAMEQANIAKEKFASFKPASPMAPTWGAQQNEAIIKDCQGK